MNKPRYIVYALTRFKSPQFIRLNIIEWKTRKIYEYVKHHSVLGHIKRLTPNLIKPKFEPEGDAALPNEVVWYRKDENCVLSNEELYRSATLENIKEVIEELKGAKLHYMYSIY